jgi:hypothetical protein
VAPAPLPPNPVPLAPLRVPAAFAPPPLPFGSSLPRSKSKLDLAPQAASRRPMHAPHSRRRQSPATATDRVARKNANDGILRRGTRLVQHGSQRSWRAARRAVEARVRDDILVVHLAKEHDQKL